jgi:hypothetical protein
VRVLAPEVRLSNPLLGREAEDAFGLRAHESELKSLGVSFLNDGVKRVDETRAEVRVKRFYGGRLDVRLTAHGAAPQRGGRSYAAALPRMRNVHFRCASDWLPAALAESEIGAAISSPQK